MSSEVIPSEVPISYGARTGAINRSPRLPSRENSNNHPNDDGQNLPRADQQDGIPQPLDQNFRDGAIRMILVDTKPVRTETSAVNISRHFTLYFTMLKGAG